MITRACILILLMASAALAAIGPSGTVTPSLCDCDTFCVQAKACGSCKPATETTCMGKSRPVPRPGKPVRR